MIAAHKGQWASRLAAVLVLSAGGVIAWVDTRPTWDDTGVTAAALVAAAGLGALWGLRPWVAAVCAVLPLVTAEARQAGAGLIIAPAVAFVGALGGALVRPVMAPRSDQRRR